jgi:hypothetical protein
MHFLKVNVLVSGCLCIEDTQNVFPNVVNDPYIDCCLWPVLYHAVHRSCACDCNSISFPNCSRVFSEHHLFLVFFWQIFRYLLLLHFLSNFYRRHLAIWRPACTEVQSMCGRGAYEIPVEEWIQSAVLVMRNWAMFQPPMWNVWCI